MAKGSIDDVAWIFVSVFVVAIIWLFFSYILFAFDAKWQALPIATAESKTAVHDLAYNGVDTMWNTFPFLFFGLFFVALLFASQVRAHPAFIWISLIIGSVDIILASVLGYVFGAFSSNAMLLTVITRYPVVDFIFANYAAIVTVMILIMLVVLYVKIPGMEEGGNRG